MEAIKKIRKLNSILTLVGVLVLSLVIGGSALASDSQVRPLFNVNPSAPPGQESTPFITTNRPADDTAELTRERCDEVDWCELRDEADFLRFGLRGELGNGIGVDFCHDQTLDLWFYVHNGVSQETNNVAGNWASGDTTNDQPFWNDHNSQLDGPSVARDTTIRLDVPGQSAGSHTVTASIAAANAETVTDSVEIACSDPNKQISLAYVADNTILTTRAPTHGELGAFQLRGDIDRTDGAILGYGDGGEGIVPSCFEFAAVVRAQLRVIVTEESELIDETPVDPQNPDEVPLGDPEIPQEPVGKTDEEIPPLGGSGNPLLLSSLAALGAAVIYRAVRRLKN